MILLSNSPPLLITVISYFISSSLTKLRKTKLIFTILDDPSIIKSKSDSLPDSCFVTPLDVFLITFEYGDCRPRLIWTLTTGLPASTVQVSLAVRSSVNSTESWWCIQVKPASARRKKKTNSVQLIRTKFLEHLKIKKTFEGLVKQTFSH